MPVFKKRKVSPFPQPIGPGFGLDGHFRGDLVVRMMESAAANLLPERWPAAALAALAVADQLFPEPEEEAANG